jgi:hypothetical protein
MLFSMQYNVTLYRSVRMSNDINGTQSFPLVVIGSTYTLAPAASIGMSLHPLSVKQKDDTQL